MAFLKSPKEFWIALIYFAIGGAALYIGADYRMGTGARMGPGYFPKVLAWALIGLGIISLIRAVALKGDAATGIAWKPFVFILAASAAFGWVLPRLGLVAALLVLCLGSAAASREFRFDPKASVGLIALIIFCAAVFVKGLGVPMPLWGAWLEPFVGGLPAWLR